MKVVLERLGPVVAAGLVMVGCAADRSYSMDPSVAGGPEAEQEAAPTEVPRRAPSEVYPLETDAEGNPVRVGYLLYLPEDYDPDSAVPYPLLIILHGSGMETLSFETFAQVSFLPPILEERQDDPPFIVLVPQSLPAWNWGDELSLLNAMLEEVIQNHAVDTTRMYLSGHSMGAGGVWCWAAAYPARFAAIVPIAGRWPYDSGDPRNDPLICGLKDVPIWMFFSQGDPYFAPEKATNVVEAFEGCGGGDVNMTIFASLDHTTVFAVAMSEPALYDWLLEQSVPAPDLPAGATGAASASSAEMVLVPGEIDEERTPTSLGYVVFLPPGYGETPDRTYPLRIALHGAGAGGVDIEDFAQDLRLPEVLDGREEEFPFITLVPQGLPSSGWELQLDFLDNMLDAVIAEYAVDEDRIYLTGFSMGGAGVWAWAAHAPDRFAALAPIAGYWPYAQHPSEDERVCALAQVPIWMFHSEADETVPVQNLFVMDEALTACGAENANGTLFPDLDHSRTALHIYQDLALFRWLVSQSR
jgi:predicted peptidase